MSFVVSKVLWALIQPSNFVLLALILAAALAGSRPILARRMLWMTVISLLIVTFFPVGQWLRLPIERRFPELVDLPAKVDGIIVLGGAVVVSSTIGRTYLDLNAAAERMTVSADVARRRPEAKLVYSGFKGRLVEVADKAPDIVDFYVRHGVERFRIVLEGDSRNTYENAVLSKELIDPAPGETWILITSASHMPRAFGVFQKLGWPVVPMPVDFRHPRNPKPRDYLARIAQPSTSLAWRELDQAVKAWVGLIAYRLMGRTTTLLPGP
ncbi:MAG: YdcF family protein [Geminicoccaceae bacterium]